MAPTQRAGLATLADEHVQIAGMTGGADSVDDLDLLRHGALPTLFGGIRAPSTPGSFLRLPAWGNVLQLGKVQRLMMAELTRRCCPAKRRWRSSMPARSRNASTGARSRVPLSSVRCGQSTHSPLTAPMHTDPGTTCREAQIQPTAGPRLAC